MSSFQSATLLLLTAVLAGLSEAGLGDVTPVHDPCVAKDGDAYYVYSTHGGLHVRRSKDLLEWEYLGRALPALPAWTREAVPGVRGLWAPDLVRVGGEWRLYYSASTFGKNRSAIGLATNATLDPGRADYRWEDKGPVVTSEPSRDDFNAIDPNVVLDADGTPWLSFGSFWSGIKLCRLDPATGKRADGVLHHIAGRHGGAIEAPFVVRRGGFYYLFVSFDKCCDGVKSTYNIRVGRSRDVTGPYADRDGRPMTDGGGTPVLAGYGRYRGPGHNAVLLGERGGDWLVHHYYDGEAGGRQTLCVRRLTWDEDGWPVAGEPIGSTPEGEADPTRD